MIIRSVRHRGLRLLLEHNVPRFIRPDLAGRVRNVLTALVLARDMNGFVTNAPPGWRVHQLGGERRNEWSISVSGNWRITFEETAGAIEHLDLEDYH